MAAPGGAHRGGFAAGVARAGVRAEAQQLGGGLPVAEPRRAHQGRIALGAALVDPRAVGHQQPHATNLSVQRGHDGVVRAEQGKTAVFGSFVQVGVVTDEQLDQLRMMTGRRDHERGAFAPAGEVHVRAFFDEHPGNIEVSQGRRDLERGNSQGVDLANVHAIGRHLLHGGQIAVLHGGMEIGALFLWGPETLQKGHRIPP